MNAAVEDAIVQDYGYLIPTLELPDNVKARDKSIAEEGARYFGTSQSIRQD